MRGSVKRAFLVWLALPCAIGCNDVSWPNSRILSSLRVLAVRAEPASVHPGQGSRLALLCADGAKPDPACDVEVAWFAACNNPENNDPMECLNHYSGWFRGLSGPVSEAPRLAGLADFEIAPEFDYTAPSDILQAEVSVAGQPLRYGVAYVFFAACAGRLYPAPGMPDQLPVQCRDRDTGALLDQKRFVVGVTTLYAYDLVRNDNPVIANPRFDGLTIPQQACSIDADCGPGFACLGESQCVPSVPRCVDSSTCRPHCLDVEVPTASFALTAIDGTPLASPLKSLWVEYYANMGGLPDDAGFGWHLPPEPATSVRSFCAMWQAPAQASSEARVWLVLRDDRGGLAWHAQRIVVR